MYVCVVCMCQVVCVYVCCICVCDVYVLGGVRVCVCVCGVCVRVSAVGLRSIFVLLMTVTVYE